MSPSDSLPQNIASLPYWSKDRKFYEHAYRRPFTLLGLKVRLGRAYDTLDALLTRADYLGCAVSPVVGLATEIGVQPRTIYRHLDALERAGALVVEHIPGDPRGRRNRYWIQPLERLARVLGLAADLVARITKGSAAVAGTVTKAVAAGVAAGVAGVTRRQRDASASVRQMSPPHGPEPTPDVTSSAPRPYISSNWNYDGGGTSRASARETTPLELTHRRTDPGVSAHATQLTKPAVAPDVAGAPAVLSAIAAGLSWPQIPAATARAWQGDIAALLATAASVEEATAYIRAFFADGWWRQPGAGGQPRSTWFTAAKLLGRFDSWRMAHRAATAAPTAASPQARRRLVADPACTRCKGMGIVAREESPTRVVAVPCDCTTRDGVPVAAVAAS